MIVGFGINRIRNIWEWKGFFIESWGCFWLFFWLIGCLMEDCWVWN